MVNRRDFIKRGLVVGGSGGAIGAAALATQPDEAEAVLFPKGNNYRLLMSKPVGSICIAVGAGVTGWETLKRAGKIAGGNGAVMVAAGTVLTGCGIREVLKREFGTKHPVAVYRVKGNKGRMSDGDLVFRQDKTNWYDFPL